MSRKQKFNPKPHEGPVHSSKRQGGKNEYEANHMEVTWIFP